MKAKHTKITTRPSKKPPGILTVLMRSCIVASSLFVAAPISMLAVDAVWLLNPDTNDWNTGTNWSPPNAPINPGDTATFNTSARTLLSLSGSATAESITFNPGASAFTINTNGNTLRINGPGIVNNSGTTQTITNNGGATGFFNTSTAGSATITNNGSASSTTFGGFTGFHDSSTAGSAVITNNGTTVSGGIEGDLIFFDTSTAGNAVITNNGGTVFGGFTGFVDSSTAGNAAITNNGSAVSGGSGSTEFNDNSTAGNAKITNNGATVSGGNGGLTEFFNTSRAGSASITNNGSTVSGGGGGLTEFFDNSTAGSATITTNGGTGGGLGGTTLFAASSDGGTARAITNGNGSFDISGLTTAGMGIGSIEGSGNYFLGSKTLTVGGNNLSTLVSGVITDVDVDGVSLHGSLTKVGTGTLTLTGFNRYTGKTTVNAGSLIVDGSIASAQTLVDAGGLLGGTGIIGEPVPDIGSLGGSLVNSGVVSPGNSLGTLTVRGDYTQNAGGTLRIEVAGAALGAHDLLQVGGRASLAGTLQLIRIGGFKLRVGDQITFLTAKTVSGTFGTVQNEFVTDTLVKAELVYLPDAVVLEGTQGSFVPSACTPNTVAVARALDSTIGDSRASSLIEFLDNEPLNKLCSDFDLIAPEELASIYTIGVSLANVQTANLKRRMDDIRAGSTGFSEAGLTINGSVPTSSAGLAGVTGPEGKRGESVMAPTPENRWGVWITGVGEFTNVDSTNNASGFDLRTGGVSFGADYRVSSNFAIGLTGGYAHTGADFVNNGDLDVNSGTFGLYATAFGNGFYLDTAVTGGPSGYDSHRTGLLGTASGSTGGGDLNVLIAGGYDWKYAGLSIGPTANFQYTYIVVDGFTESGSLAPLNVHGQHADSIRTAFGMKASYDWKVGRVLIIPELRAAWQHEYGNSAYSIVASFANGAGNSFTVNGPAIGRDSLLIGAGAAVLLSERVSIYAYYDGELLRNNYQSNNVSAGIRITF